MSQTQGSGRAFTLLRRENRLGCDTHGVEGHQHLPLIDAPGVRVRVGERPEAVVSAPYQFTEIGARATPHELSKIRSIRKRLTRGGEIVIENGQGLGSEIQFEPQCISDEFDARRHQLDNLLWRRGIDRRRVLFEPSGVDHSVAITRSITIFATAFLVVIAATATAAAFLVAMVFVLCLVIATATAFSDVVTARAVLVVIAAASVRLVVVAAMVFVLCLVIATATAFSDVVTARAVLVVIAAASVRLVVVAAAAAVEFCVRRFGTASVRLVVVAAAAAVEFCVRRFGTGSTGFDVVGYG